MRLHLCDDHLMFCEGLGAVLRGRGHDVAGYTASPAAALEAIKVHPVDVVMLDLGFPEGGAIETIPALAAEPGTHVVVLSASDDVALLGAAVGAGASGIAHKSDDVDRIVTVIERVNSGEAVIDERALRAAFGAPSAPDDPAWQLAKFLTAREREVLERLVRGESTAALAQSMGIRYSTVRTHVQNMLSKLGVHSMLAAVTLAVNHGLVDTDTTTSPTFSTGVTPGL